MKPYRLRVLTLNLHKGLSFFTREVVVHKVRELLLSVDADIVLLQEAVGENRGRRPKRRQAIGHHQLLAAEEWEHTVYGKNAVYPKGHHGNAILSRSPIESWKNLDISESKLEHRGLLHVRVALKHEVVDLVCLHLGLRRRWRRSQLDKVVKYLQKNVPADSPLIIGGDFNDFSNDARKLLLEPLAMTQALRRVKPIRTYPAFLPLFSIDRIYVRGFDVESASRVRHGRGFRSSDHAGIIAEIVRAPRSEETEE